MGALNDDQMDGRVQVTLVITGGIGRADPGRSHVQRSESFWTTVGDSSERGRSSQAPEHVHDTTIRTGSSPQPATPKIRSLLSSQELSASASQNLDLPAFLRRQSRLTGL